MDDFKKLKITNYLQIRDQIRTGDTLTFSGKGLWSNSIEKITDSNASHVAVIIRDDRCNRIMVYESLEPDGVRYVPLSLHLKEYKGEIIILRHKNFPKRVNYKKIGKIYDTFGKKYDKKELVRILWRRILEDIGLKKLFNLKFKPNINDLYICSEAWKSFYELFKVNIPYNEDGTIVPADSLKNNDFEFICRIK